MYNACRRTLPSDAAPPTPLCPPKHVTNITYRCDARRPTLLSQASSGSKTPYRLGKTKESKMPDTTDGRRNFLKTALASLGAAAGLLFARSAVASDPMVRDMANRASKTSFDDRQQGSAALCDKASCNPGCQNGCKGGCQASCKTGNK
jgi:hypothetical protein